MPVQLYESDRIAEMDIATAFARRVRVTSVQDRDRVDRASKEHSQRDQSSQSIQSGVNSKLDDFVASGVFHVKTRRVVAFKAGVSRMQRSRTIGFRVQRTPVRRVTVGATTVITVAVTVLVYTPVFVYAYTCRHAWLNAWV